MLLDQIFAKVYWRRTNPKIETIRLQMGSLWNLNSLRKHVLNLNFYKIWNFRESDTRRRYMCSFLSHFAFFKDIWLRILWTVKITWLSSISLGLTQQLHLCKSIFHMSGFLLSAWRRVVLSACRFLLSWRQIEIVTEWDNSHNNSTIFIVHN